MLLFRDIKEELIIMYDFGCEFSQVYKSKCECGNIVEVSAQEDDHPEYYVSVFVRCECGKSVEFSLPVN